MSRLFAVVSGFFRTLGLLAFPHSWRGVGLGKRSAVKSCLVPLIQGVSLSIALLISASANARDFEPRYWYAPRNNH